MDPDEALRQARERRVDYEGDPALAPTDLDELGEAGIRPRQLREWALIEVEPEALRSTRRLGAPVTFAKRLLLRLLRQYTTELEARQTRFNLAVLTRLDELEERTRALERERDS